MTIQKTQTPDQIFGQITEFLTRSRQHVAEGGDADLTGLDEKVQELCESVMAMPREEAELYHDKLAVVATQLTQLREELQRMQVDVQRQLSALDLRHKAAKAYKNTEAAEAQKKDD